MRSNQNKFIVTVAIAVTGILLAAAGNVEAALLYDDFDNDDLATNPSGTGTGFAFADNGVGTAGSATEASSQAQITDGTGSGYNMSGIYSKSAVDLSDDSLEYTVTWNVAAYEHNASDLSRNLHNLQDHDGFKDGGSYNLEVRLFSKDSVNNNTGKVKVVGPGWDVTQDLTSISQSDTDGYTLTAVFDVDGFAITSTGLASGQQVNINETWSGLGTTYGAQIGSTNLRPGSYIQDGTGAVVGTLDIDSIEVIPEPLSATALLAGFGIIAIWRRRFKAE